MKRLLILLGCSVLLFAACKKTIDYDPADIPNDFVGLPPLPADSGIQFRIPAFPIPANFEKEFFMLKELGNEDTIFVNSIRSKCRPGTHHFVLQDIYEDKDFPLPPVDMMIDQNNLDGSFNIMSRVNTDAILFEAQNADYTLSLPPGYAIQMAPHKKIFANSHYYNKTNEVRFGEVHCNFYTLPKNQVQQLVLNDLIDGNAALNIPPKGEQTITTDFIVDKKTQFLILAPHYHKRGYKFEVQIIGGAQNGQTILESYDYQHPNIGLYFNTPLILNPGEGLRTIVTYKNESNRTIKYGVTSEDEMNYLFYYYFTLP